MLDSLAQPMGTLEMDAKGRAEVRRLDGTVHRVTGMHMRGRGCAASLDQQNRFMLLQVMARGGGTQAFVDTAALDQATRVRQAALAAFNTQLGGGTGVRHRAGREISGVRKLANPRVGAVAHARLSNGTINSVDEYDAKPAYGNVVYFMSNTTAVHAGGITRGMVRVGTAVAKVDTFGYCDPSSDDTLTWRYWSIHTGIPGRGMYGWIPARCPRRDQGPQAGVAAAAPRRLARPAHPAAPRRLARRTPTRPPLAGRPPRVATVGGRGLRLETAPARRRRRLGAGGAAALGDDPRA